MECVRGVRECVCMGCEGVCVYGVSGSVGMWYVCMECEGVCVRGVRECV